MSNVLLVGAGFSHNWGGWLAGEIHNALFGVLARDAELNRLLREAGSFEEALGQVQADFKTQPSVATKGRLDRLQAAILRVFSQMNDAFAARGGMEFGNTVEFSIIRFLSQFDVIFSLNQDLLFELHYNISLQAPRRWNGHSFPGMRPPANWQGKTLPDRLNEVWQPEQEFRIEGNLQPVFKLHGSVNWRDRDGGELLVMGTNKPSTIRQKAILAWYSDQLLDYLSRPETRLMIVGYGFRDEHINAAILKANRGGRLGMFLVHPRGREAFNTHPHGSIRPLNPFDDIPLLGVSTRPLSSTFRDDQMAHRQLLAFFDAH